MSPSTSGHCAIPGCAEDVGPRMLMCTRHWCLAPASVKAQLRDAFDPETDVQSEDWTKAARAAVTAAQRLAREAEAVPALRALTEIQPWGWAIVSGHKPIENRSWVPPGSLQGQPICIHGGKRYDGAAEAEIARLCGLPELPPQAHDQGILGVAWLDRVLDDEESWTPDDPLAESPWFSGRFGWVFRDAIAFPTPLECRGMQGLWPVPAALAAKVWYRVCVEKALRS